MEHKSEDPAAPASANGAENAALDGTGNLKTTEQPERAQAVVIGKVKKNARESIRVALDEFKGSRYVDVRVFVPGSDGQDKPTKAGCTLKLAAIPALIELLQRAHAEAQARGLT